MSAELANVVADLVTANRILAHEGVMDAYGHVTIRHPQDSDKYLMSRSRAPDLVEVEDIMTFALEGRCVDDRGRAAYAERAIHGAIYETRPEIGAVVHNHSYEVLPFGVTSVPIRPIVHVCAPIGHDIPVWDIRERFGETDHLVVTMEQGRDLARCLGRRPVALMKRHGCVVAARNVREAVMTAVYLQVNARLQFQAMQLGTPDYLTAKEIDECTARQVTPLALDRAWEYWARRSSNGKFS